MLVTGALLQMPGSGLSRAAPPQIRVRPHPKADLCPNAIGDGPRVVDQTPARVQPIHNLC